jgi:hypothetical protein
MHGSAPCLVVLVMVVLVMVVLASCSCVRPIDSGAVGAKV